MGNSSQSITSQSSLVVGQTYSIGKLLDEMIIYSDNNAADTLARALPKDALQTTFVDLGINIPQGDKLYDFVTAKTYANVFRILYNASYLDRTYSEKALELMQKTAFPGIAAGVPKDIVVVHKFGEREFMHSDGTARMRELHDCGIVYKVGQPYSLCIMTEGRDLDSLTTIVEDISRLVYNGL